MLRCAVFTATAALLATAATAEDGAPLDRHPTQIGTLLSTANTLHRGQAQLSLGLAQTSPNAGPGTGNQIYYFGVEYGVSDRLTFGIHAETHEDPTISPILGGNPAIGMDTLVASAKFLAYDGDAVDLAVVGSAGFLRFSSTVFGSGAGGDDANVIGSLSVPVSVDVSPSLQFHIAPGVSFLPDNLGGVPFYGTVAHLGAGATYRATERITAFAAVAVPVSGGNTVTSAGTISQEPVWTVGGRYNITPKGAVELYATNGVGTTPATSILTYWPGGDEILYGARLVWTPGNGPEYRSSYRSLRALTRRETNAQLDGFTLASADTHEPGSIVATAWGGTEDAYGAGLIIAPDQDGQIEGYFERRANDGSVPAALTSVGRDRYMFGLKLRLLDQNNGSPFSFSARVLGGREVGSGTPGVGVLYVETPASYKASPALTISATPKIAAFGNTEIFGLGLGANIAVSPDLELIGEVTATQNGNGTVWAAGARYNLGDSGFSIDAHASNATGTRDIGTLVAQDSVRYTLGLTKRFDASGWR